MFASLVVEREPSRLEGLPASFQGWLLTVGALSLVALIIWVIAYLIRPPKGLRPRNRLTASRFLLAVLLGGAALAALPLLLSALLTRMGYSVPEIILPGGGDARMKRLGFNLLTFLAAVAFVIVLLPLARNLPELRLQRIWALAKLSFKEAIRGRVLWSFSALILVLLFANWYLPYKAEDQVRNYVRVVYWAMAPLMILGAAALAAFSIPADLKKQTMHTIVTKPVERFEIVLGRCLGFVMLMSLVLGIVTGFGLLYVSRNITPEAYQESYRARVPVFGNMQIFQGRQVSEGVSVGREWEYRRYISGGATNEAAVWAFYDLPSNIADKKTVRCEFAFDIFRTTKGRENEGVFCTFLVQNAHWDPAKLNEYKQKRDRALAAEGRLTDEARAEILSPLAEEYGYYELPSKEVADYHTMSFEIPVGMFKNATAARPAAGGPPQPPLVVGVRLESPTQYLGVNKYDLYLLDGENTFEWNFFKGAAGLWFRLCLVIAVAVTLSTYLSGIISFLTTLFLYGAGLLLDFIRSIAEGKNDGGGPLESLIRLAQGANVMTPLDATPTVRVALTTDYAFRAFLRGVLNMIPDVDRFDLTNYVASGYNISAGLLLWDNLVPLVAYLLPCLVLAFYLIRSREIAS